MSKSAQNSHHLQAETPCAGFWKWWKMVSPSPKPKIRNMTSSGCHNIPKTRRHIWDRGIERWWHELVWIMEGKGLVVKWMVDKAGRSALMSSIPLMIYSWSGPAGSNSSVTGQVNVWQQVAQQLSAPKPSWTCSKEKESFCNCWSSLGLCIPLIATSVTFSCVGGSKSKFEGSSPCPLMTSGQRWKTSMRQYWANTSAQKQQRSRSGARHFCLQMAAIWSTFWHLCRLEISQYYVDFYTC